MSHAHAQSAQQEMKSPETVQTHQDGLQHGRKNRLQDMKESDQASEAISMMEKHPSAQATIHCASPSWTAPKGLDGRSNAMCSWPCPGAS